MSIQDVLKFYMIFFVIGKGMSGHRSCSFPKPILFKSLSES